MCMDEGSSATSRIRLPASSAPTVNHLKPSHVSLMSLWKIAWRSIQQRSLASALTALSMALGVSLVVAVLVIHSVVYQSFHRGGEGYDLVVGPPRGAAGTGAQRRLLHGQADRRPCPMNTTRSCTTAAPGSMASRRPSPSAWATATRTIALSAPRPTCSTEIKYLGEQSYEFAEGRNFKDGANFIEAVIGATVARKTGLKVGSTFRPTHDVERRTRSTNTSLHGRRHPRADRHAQRPGAVRQHRGLLPAGGPHPREDDRGRRSTTNDAEARRRKGPRREASTNMNTGRFPTS